MDTIDAKMAGAWSFLQMEEEIAELKAQLNSWVCHYDTLDLRFEKLCDALHVIVGLEEHELEKAPWLAKTALQEVGKWPNN